MPSLPRIRSRRGIPVRVPAEDTRPRITELHGEGITWVHLLAPTTEEAQQLAGRFGWHPLDVEDVLSRRQRPKVDLYTGEEEGRGGYLFAVLHFPVYDKTVGRLNAGELDVFVGPDYIVTLPAVELRPVTLLFRRAYENEQLRTQLFSRGSGRLLYEILDDLYDYCFPILDKIGFKLEQIDEDISIADQGAKELVRDIHKVKQEIISYRKIIKPQRPTLRQLERQIERFLPEELELYFDDIVDASERIWDLLDNYKEVVEALEGTNESLISHQQNDILYVLTIFLVVLTPLTFITGFFGMNVHFPGFNSWGAFLASIGFMLATVAGMLAFFRWKRWL
jgi:magnesium transporter